MSAQTVTAVRDAGIPILTKAQVSKVLGDGWVEAVVVVDSAMRTNQPGVFAAGDITDYDGKVRLIAVGFGEVAIAVNNAAVHIHPGQALFPGHSTDAAPQPAAAAS